MTKISDVNLMLMCVSVSLNLLTVNKCLSSCVRISIAESTNKESGSEFDVKLLRVLILMQMAVGECLVCGMSVKKWLGLGMGWG